ncbi:MAG: hypothetical protein ACR5K2_02545 [Wolbachia sp.]
MLESEIAGLLMKEGANANERNNRNETPLHLSAFLWHRKCDSHDKERSRSK